MGEGEFPLVLNYTKISQSDYLPLVRLMAVDMMNKPYESLKNFFTRLSSNDLNELMSLIERDNERAMENVLLMTEMLVQAEGLFSESFDQLCDHCDRMVTYLTIVSLHRKGLVDVCYENMSFGEEFLDKPVVKKKLI